MADEIIAISDIKCNIYERNGILLYKLQNSLSSQWNLQIRKYLM